jgi:hypothetical protein
MKGLAIQHIVLLIIGIIVLVLIVLLFIHYGVGPFKRGTELGRCSTFTRDYCCQQIDAQSCWERMGCSGTVPCPK